MTDESGPVFVTEDGFTLYSWRDDDRANHSKCNNDEYHRVLGRGQAVNYLPDPETRPTCEEAWPPFRPVDSTLSVGDAIGDWQVMVRHDDTLQWSYQGKPVYRSSYDDKPGDMNGVGRSYGGRTSFLGRTPLYAPIDLPPGLSTRQSAAGYVLTNAEGMTLYSSRSGGDCAGQCLEDWKPVLAPAALILDEGRDWNTAFRDDGARQWQYQGNGLYTFSGDLLAGDIKGVEQGGVGARSAIPRG